MPTVEPAALTRARREGARERWERAVDLPMTVVSLVFVVVFFLPVFSRELASRYATPISAALAVMYAAFLLDYFVRLVLAEQRLRFLWRHGLELLVVFLPPLRPAYVVLLLLTRSRLLSARGALAQRALLYVGVLSVLLTVFTAAAVVLAERPAEGRGATLTNFPDALWWSVVTVTTVGYGDYVPITPAGRLIAVIHMAVGIALVGVVTASVASWFVDRAAGERHEKDTAADDLVLEELRAVRAEIAQLRRQVADQPIRSSPEGR